MRELIKKAASCMIISSVLAIIVGLIMVIKPDLALTTVGKILSCYIILHGIMLVVIDIKAIKYYVPMDCLIPGLLSIVLGCILLGKTSILTTIFGVAVGIWIILSSVNYIRVALSIRKEQAPWLLLLIMGILDFVVGVLAIFNPFETAISTTIYFGITLIVHAIFSIINMIVMKRDVKVIAETIESNMKQIEA